MSKSEAISKSWTPERKAEAARKCRARATHGMRETAEYRTWIRIRSRCCANSLHKNRKHYVDKGITVCERWGKFENFFADMGMRPSAGHSIDRIEGSKEYSPDNCRWATAVEQANNRSSTAFVTYRGQTMPLANAVRLSGSSVQYDNVRYRLKRGWTIEDALERPVRPARRLPLIEAAA